MDIEAPNRHALKAFFGPEKCHEEVVLEGSCPGGPSVRADLVASLDLDGVSVFFAFEVKAPQAKWEFKDWNAALFQACGYSSAKITDKRFVDEKFRHRPLNISASFVFPFPSEEHPYCRAYDMETIRGAYLLAQHFKVGRASVTSDCLKLYIGTGAVWDSKSGFRSCAANRIFKRRVGSRIV